MAQFPHIDFTKPHDEIFGGPWFLRWNGRMIRDSLLAHDKIPSGEPSDYPVYSAASFDKILDFLPLIPDLKTKFKRNPEGRWRR
ncbi:hypothetical protein B0H19DRAFT_1268327 [Mycena capillaripes]|nr:hypothetical protein B0H19DRAFT_1268327 [Mycena capillaripes]